MFCFLVFKLVKRIWVFRKVHFKNNLSFFKSPKVGMILSVLGNLKEASITAAVLRNSPENLQTFSITEKEGGNKLLNKNKFHLTKQNKSVMVL